MEAGEGITQVRRSQGNQYDAKDEVYHIDLIDSGNAFVFRDGFATPAKWTRTDVNQPLLLTNLDGSPIYLRPGRTFYEVMGFTSPYTQDGNDWHFKFETPWLILLCSFQRKVHLINSPYAGDSYHNIYVAS